MRISGLGSIFTAGLTLTAVVLATPSASAQPPGGFGAQMWMDRLDENGDGRLDPEELSQSRFPLADMAERAGIDASRGLSADDVEKVFENMRQQRGGFGFGGDRGGRGGDRGDRGERGGRGGSDRGRRNSDSSSSQAKAPEPPPRVTIDLQATFAPGDENADGQLELSEWLRWKGRAALAEFLSLDRNNDGILTPRELAQSHSPLPVDLARLLPGAVPAALQPFGSTIPANPTMSGSPGAAATPPPASAPRATAGAATATAVSPNTASANPAPSAATAEDSNNASTLSADAKRHAATAERFFKVLDRDRDGKITDLEWRRSSRLRPKFEQAGADLSQPMSQEQFVDYYVKFSTSG